MPPTSLSAEQAIASLERIAANGWDIEAAHSDADDILCDLLKSLGYEKVVEAWDKVEKWYA